MLNVSEMSQICKEIVLGLPPTNRSAEAEEFRREVTPEIEEMRKAGIMCELPYDFD